MKAKEKLAQGLLELCEEKRLDKISIKELLVYTQISKQSFYNYFLDKNDLIQYIYDEMIIPNFDNPNQNIDFYDEMVICLKNMERYHYFLKQALLLEGQNCLKDYIFKHCQEFDLAFHQKLYGKQMPDSLRFATQYHAMASSSMTISWILSDMPVSCEEMAKLLTDLRGMGMDKLFEDALISGNPYRRKEN